MAGEGGVEKGEERRRMQEEGRGRKREGEEFMH